MSEAKASLGSAGSPRLHVPRVNWDAVQRCEEPVTGWRTRGSLYEGGVGFAVTTWAQWARELGLYARYPHAWMAPPAVQKRVAQYGYERGGSWGCIHEHPEYVR